MESLRDGREVYVHERVEQYREYLQENDLSTVWAVKSDRSLRASQQEMFYFT